MKPLLELAEAIGHGIPSCYYVDLENRLAIAWGERKRNRSNGKSQSKAAILSASRENRARTIYLRIQEENCLLFLPFLLAYSPRACTDFKMTDFADFRKFGTDTIQVDASAETEKLLDTMAIRRGFNQNLSYLRFMRSYFHKGSHESEQIVNTAVSVAAGVAEDELQAETTGRPGDDREIERMYSNGPMSQIACFGELLSNAIQSSHQWKKERALGETTTNCWTTMIPRDPNQDISITMWLGRKDGHRVNVALMGEPTWSSLSSPRP